MYSLQIPLLLHLKFLSVSPISPALEPKFESNIQQEPVTTLSGYLLVLGRLLDGCWVVVWTSLDSDHYFQCFTC